MILIAALDKAIAIVGVAEPGTNDFGFMIMVAEREVHVPCRRLIKVSINEGMPDLRYESRNLTFEIGRRFRPEFTVLVPIVEVVRYQFLRQGEARDTGDITFEARAYGAGRENESEAHIFADIDARYDDVGWGIHQLMNREVGAIGWRARDRPGRKIVDTNILDIDRTLSCH